MSSQKSSLVFVIFWGLLLASSSGAVLSSLFEEETSSANDQASRVETYDLSGKTAKVTITDDHIEVAVTGQEQGVNASQIVKELKSLQENCKALDKRLQALEKRHGNDFALLFPKKSTTDYVLVPRMPSLRAVTGCLRMQSSNTETKGALLSYAVAREDNELLFMSYKDLALIVDGVASSSSAGAVNDGHWHHICFTWENTAGSWNIYVNGSQHVNGTGLKTGHVIRGGGTLVLGQDQDEVGGEFATKQSFVGIMSQVNLWSRVLSAQEVFDLSTSCLTEEGNVLKWSDIKTEVRGEVQVIEPTPCGP